MTDRKWYHVHYPECRYKYTDFGACECAEKNLVAKISAASINLRTPPHKLVETTEEVRDIFADIVRLREELERSDVAKAIADAKAAMRTLSKVQKILRDASEDLNGPKLGDRRRAGKRIDGALSAVTQTIERIKHAGQR